MNLQEQKKVFELTSWWVNFLLKIDSKWVINLSGDRSKMEKAKLEILKILDLYKSWKKLTEADDETLLNCYDDVYIAFTNHLTGKNKKWVERVEYYFQRIKKIVNEIIKEEWEGALPWRKVFNDFVAAEKYIKSWYDTKFITDQPDRLLRIFRGGEEYFELRSGE